MASKTALLCGTLVAAMVAQAELVPVAPTGGETVSMQDREQRAILDSASREARLEAINALPDKKAVRWREAAKVRFSWRATESERGPWLIQLAKSPDFASVRELWIQDEDAERNGDVWTYEMPRPNLELGTEYHWRVLGGVKCSRWECGSTIGRDTCACGKTPRAKVSAAASFVTSDLPPRWIGVEGRTANIRDLGGWRTTDGKRVKCNLVFRGQGFNDNSVNGDTPGRNRLMVEDVAYLTGTLGIKTDLDLRGPREVSSMKTSPLGPGVKYIHNSSCQYADIFTDAGKKIMAENFRIFCDRANYPVYFHCNAGADRTGSLAYVINGVLGVGKEDLELDWELTFYPRLPVVKDPKDWQGTEHFDVGLAAYASEGDTLKTRIEKYLLDCGVTAEEIERVRAIMLQSSGDCP